MLQKELQQELEKAELQNKIFLGISGVFLLSTIVLGAILLRSNNNADLVITENNPSLTSELNTIQKDSFYQEFNLSELDIIRKFDSLAYIIDTLELILVRARSSAKRDYSRYLTASNYSENELKPTDTDNVNLLIENAKKFSNTDCNKSLAFLYAAKKIGQINRVSATTKSTINQMIKKCETTFFSRN